MLESEHTMDVTINTGEVVQFPVDSGHPLSSIQSITPITSVDQILDFEFARLWAHFAKVRDIDETTLATFQEEAPQDVKRAQLLARRFPTGDMFFKFAVETFGSSLVLLEPADFIVSAGATVTLANGMNKIVAGRVIITGTLRSEGHLVINARELGG